MLQAKLERTDHVDMGRQISHDGWQIGRQLADEIDQADDLLDNGYAGYSEQSPENDCDNQINQIDRGAPG